MNNSIGRFLLIAGAVAIAAGLLFIYSDRFPLLKHIGRLPGDISVKKENFSFYFPVTTSILLSILLSLVMYIVSRFR